MEKPGGFGADSGWEVLRAGRKGTGWGLVQPRGQLGGAVSPQSLDAAACTGRVGDIWIQGNTVGARLGERGAPIRWVVSLPVSTGVLASCQAPLAGNGTDQQGQLDERKAPELGGAWAPGECSGGGQGGDAAAWSPEGLPSQGAHPVGQGRRPLLDVTLAIRKSLRSARLSTFSLGLHYNHIIEAI